MKNPKSYHLPYIVRGLINNKEFKMNNYITRKTIMQETGAPHYVVDYLRCAGRLPIVKDSPGAGVPVLFGIKSIEIVKEHIERSQRV